MTLTGYVLSCTATALSAGSIAYSTIIGRRTKQRLASAAATLQRTAATLAQINQMPPCGQPQPLHGSGRIRQDAACHEHHPAYDADTRLATPNGQCTRCGLLIRDDRGQWRAVAVTA
jgi:hypothetical protein